MVILTTTGTVGSVAVVRGGSVLLVEVGTISLVVLAMAAILILLGIVLSDWFSIAWDLNVDSEAED